MSVRAHRVEEIRVNGESFNLWHDREVIQWLRENTVFFESLNYDCCGFAELEVEDLQSMLSDIGDRLSGPLKKAIEEDIQFAKDRGDWYVRYYCY